MVDAIAPWFPSSELLAYLKVDAGSENGTTVELCRVAAAAVVARQRPDLKLDDPLVVEAPAGVKHGAVLLAARLYARKGTPEGIATFGELGASSILRTDPDIGMLLGVGRFARPVAR